jgi:hypothetical protein
MFPTFLLLLIRIASGTTPSTRNAMFLQFVTGILYPEKMQSYLRAPHVSNTLPTALIRAVAGRAVQQPRRQP